MIWFVDLKLPRCMPGSAERESFDYTIAGRRWWGQASSREEALRRARAAA